MVLLMWHGNNIHDFKINSSYYFLEKWCVDLFGAEMHAYFKAIMMHVIVAVFLWFKLGQILQDHC